MSTRAWTSRIPCRIWSARDIAGPPSCRSTVVVARCDGQVPLTGVRGEPDEGVGVERRCLESRGEPFVLLGRVALVEHHPVIRSDQRVKTPVHQHAEAVVLKSFEPGFRDVTWGYMAPTLGRGAPYGGARVSERWHAQCGWGVADGWPVGVMTVRPWRPGLTRSVLPPPYQDLLEVLADAGRPLRAGRIAAAAGLSTGKSNVEGLRSKLKRLAERGWLAEEAPGLFMLPRRHAQDASRPAPEGGQAGVPFQGRGGKAS